MNNQPLRSLGLAVLIGGLLAGSLTGCAARRLRAAETATAGAAQPTAAGPDQGGSPAATAAVTAAANPADQIDAQLEKMATDLNSADTLNDFSTTLPPDSGAATSAAANVAAAESAAATVTPAAGAATSTPAANSPTSAPPPTSAPSGSDQGAQIDQMLSAMQTQLNNTDTVPQAANP